MTDFLSTREIIDSGVGISSGVTIPASQVTSGTFPGTYTFATQTTMVGGICIVQAGHTAVQDIFITRRIFSATGLTIQSPTNSPFFLSVFHNSILANGDTLGYIEFEGLDSSGTAQFWGGLEQVVVDATAATATGRVFAKVLSNAVLIDAFHFDANGITVDTGGIIINSGSLSIGGGGITIPNNQPILAHDSGGTVRTMIEWTAADKVLVGTSNASAVQVAANNFQPALDNTIDVGASSLAFRDVYVARNLLFNGANGVIVASPTQLSWRNAANTADNLLILDGGAATFRGLVTMPAGLLVSVNNVAISGKDSGNVTRTIAQISAGNKLILGDGNLAAASIPMSVQPGSTGAFDLGASSLAWRDGWFSRTVNIATDAGLVFTNGTDRAGANTGTLTNSPHNGNPAHWATVSWNGTNYAIPLFALS